MSSNPLLGSVENISHTTSTTFACIYAVFWGLMSLKVVKAETHRFALILLTLLAIARVITFALRAHLSRIDPVDSSFHDTAIGAAVMLVAGYLFLLEALCSLALKWLLRGSWVVISKSQDFFIHLIEHIVLATISIIGILGAIHEINATDISSLNRAKHERIASAVLFFLVLFACSGAILLGTTRFRMNQRGFGYNGGIRAGIFLGAWTICAAVENVYRIWSSASDTGFIIDKIAVDVLVFTPEAAVFLLVIVVDFSSLERIRFFFAKKGGARFVGRGSTFE